jgi:hypothetical protein
VDSTNAGGIGIGCATYPAQTKPAPHLPFPIYRRE